MLSIRCLDFAANARRRHDDKHIREMIPRKERTCQADASCDQRAGPHPILSCGNEQLPSATSIAHELVQRLPFRLRSRPGIKLTGHDSR
jgi:hypothetical protein